MAPLWFEVLASVAIGVALLCCLALIIEVFRHPQRMAVMNWVWPVTALYFGPVALIAYQKLGKPQARISREQAPSHDEDRQSLPQPEREAVSSAVRGEAPAHPDAREANATPTKRDERQESNGLKARKPQRPFWQSVWVAVTHCGTGCTLGDMIAETAVFFFAWKLAGVDYWPAILLDFTLAYLLGIVFQYFSIAPMRGISGWPGVWAAIKADTLSLLAFEIGLFAWMALSAFIWFPHAQPDQPAFWFMMQIGMIIGFATSYPMNWWLLRRGIKEVM